MANTVQVVNRGPGCFTIGFGILLGFVLLAIAPFLCCGSSVLGIFGIGAVGGSDVETSERIVARPDRIEVPESEVQARPPLSASEMQAWWDTEYERVNDEFKRRIQAGEKRDAAYAALDEHYARLDEWRKLSPEAQSDYIREQRSDTLPEPEPEPDATVESPPSAELVASQPSHRVLRGTVTLGDIRVQLKSAFIQRPTLKHLGEETSAENKQLVLTLSMRNMSQTRKVEYTTWRGGTWRSGATLTDNLGNNYRHIEYGWFADLDGAVEEASIYPEQYVSDVLVFQKPVDSAEYLELRLPGDAIGHTGDAIIRIPVDVIVESF